LPIDKQDYENLIDSVMDEITDAIFSRSQENIMKNGSGDTGQMLQSGNVNRKFLEKEIVYSAPQSIWIEYGTDPHPVSKKGRENIQSWATRKLGVSGKEAERVSWGIVKKINREGSQAQPFVRPAIQEVMLRGF